MPTPEPVTADRLEELLGGAAPTHEPEVRLQGIVRALRTEAPAAPDELRARVVAGDAPRSARLRRPTWRRVALVAVPAAAAFAATSFLVSGTDDAPRRDAAASAPSETVAGAAATESLTTRAPDSESKNAYLEEALSTSGGTERAKFTSPLPDTARARDVDMALELRLRDADELSAAANDAMRISRELGGFVAASRVDTRWGEGTADITLHVPVRRLEDAVVRLSTLGTITAQDVTIQDLQRRLDQRTRRIELVQRAIRADELRLESGTLDPEERLEVELRLERSRALLRDLRRQRAALLRRAATAEIDLTLHTRAAAAAPDAGGAAGAARDAFDLLGRAGTGLVFSAILVGPLLLVLTAAWLAFSRRSRRRDERLLGEPRPGLARD